MGADRVVKNCNDGCGCAEWVKEMADMETEEIVLESDNRFQLTGWPYSVDPGDEPYKRQEGGNHYQNFAIQPHEYIVKNNIPWSAANAIKYLSRYRFKGGKTDLLKAKHYIELAIAEEYPE